MIEIIYVSRDGQTSKIAHYIQQYLSSRQMKVEITDITQNVAYRLNPKTKHVVIGVPIRYGNPMSQAKQWLKIQDFTDVEVSAFNVNLTARKPEKSEVSTCPYAQKFVSILPEKVHHLAIFAGALDYPKYRWFDRKMIQLIMWMTKGPTHSNSRIEFTQWQAVDDFSEKLVNMN